LSLRAGHPDANIVTVHGDLWNLKCERKRCGYSEKNLKDPIVPALLVGDKEFPNDEDVPNIPKSELPHCPKCGSLLRPGVVFFNEQLPSFVKFQTLLTLESATDKVQEWLFDKHVDLVLLIGTSGLVYPAAGYTWDIKMRGGKVAVFNIEHNDSADRMHDWLFEGTSPLLTRSNIRTM
jgi:NAD+-dependent protein deacetylase sirtuin 5